MTPKERYQIDLTHEGFHHDPAQDRAIEQIERLYARLTAPQRPSHPGLMGIFRKAPVASVKGLYLWGGVGRGKTYLVEIFYDCLKFSQKRRVHFQRFMQEIHRDLKALPKSPDPLPILANSLARETRILCLDEFHVDDVADAMLLAGLLKGLIESGVTLVFTSNIRPEELYLHGLQRQRFLPAIDSIKTHTEEIHVDGETDYRLGLLEQTETFFTPNDERAKQALLSRFKERVGADGAFNVPLEINKRTVIAKAQGTDVIWFDFGELCATPRSSADYLRVAEIFNTVFISDIAAMDESTDDVVNRFIQLIDALYDHNVCLIASAEVGVTNLYKGERQAFAFRRTISRLQEMFSLRYTNSRTARK